MRAVIQRVSWAKVEVDDVVIGQISRGYCILVGAGQEDTLDDVAYLAQKTIDLRIFPDADGKMNLSLLEIKGEVLAISQFTLMGDARKGRRPSFIAAMSPEPAKDLYEKYVTKLGELGVNKVQTGRFGADMKVSLLNDGPVTILLDSKKLF